MVKETDYCGLVSGKNVDKGEFFEVFYGELKTAPMIAECPINMECRLIQTVDFPRHDIFVGEIVAAGINDDEGYMLGGVTRILDGQVPYRDFHHTYAPGRFYLVAALFRLFGEDLLVVRALWVVLRVAVVLLAWAAARRLLPRPEAAAVALMLIVAPGPWHKSFFHLFLIIIF